MKAEPETACQWSKCSSRAMVNPRKTSVFSERGRDVCPFVHSLGEARSTVWELGCDMPTAVIRRSVVPLHFVAVPDMPLAELDPLPRFPHPCIP